MPRGKVAKRGITSVLAAIALLGAGATAAFASEDAYWLGSIGSGDNKNSNYLGWQGWNHVYGPYRVCAGQARQDYSFYGSYACVTSGSVYKTYPSFGYRRARAHNGWSGTQYVQGYVGY